MRKSARDENRIEASSGNVFTDLGFDDAEAQLRVARRLPCIQRQNQLAHLLKRVDAVRRIAGMRRNAIDRDEHLGPAASTNIELELRAFANDDQPRLELFEHIGKGQPFDLFLVHTGAHEHIAV